MKKISLIVVSIFCSILSFGQGLFNYEISTELNTPKGKYMAFTNKDNSCSYIPDSTECVLKFRNSYKNSPYEIKITGQYVKKIGNSFLFTSSSKLSFVLDAFCSNPKPSAASDLPHRRYRFAIRHSLLLGFLIR